MLHHGQLSPGCYYTTSFKTDLGLNKNNAVAVNPQVRGPQQYGGKLCLKLLEYVKPDSKHSPLGHLSGLKIIK